MTAVPASAPAVGAARHAARRNAKQRRFVTPEGIDLQLEIASAGLRFGALVIDLTLMLVILTIVTLILVYGTPGGAGQATLAVWLVGFFLLRN
ncbi:MAG: RDD family protein, partial [Sphingopyxis sp.]|nr:RDD family protein [Sphingopyxis sp.]